MATATIAEAGEPGPATEIEGELSDTLARVDKEVRAFVKERPVLALLGAITAGYLIGRVLRQRG
jgi:hypothetical protein